MKERIIPIIEVKQSSITTIQVDAVVNPSNGFGYMGGGVAGAIKKVGGQEIEDEAVDHAPIQIGEAVVTTAGDLVASFVVHAPTMHNPGEKTDAHKVFCAVKAALESGDSQGLKSIAIPGMGTGVGELDKNEAAETIIKAIKEFEFQSIQRVVLLDINSEMVEAFKKGLDIKS